MQTSSHGFTRSGLWLFAAVSLLAGCSGSPSNRNQSGSSSSNSQAPLQIGVIPYENPQQQQEEYKEFGAYLGQKTTGSPATVTIASDYAGVVSALESGTIDVAYLNPLSYVIAADRSQKSGNPLVPLAMPDVIPKGHPHGSLTYRGVIFARADSGIRTLKDLKGKTIAFNEPTSTSGYLYPYSMLMKAGINPKPEVEGGDLKQAMTAGAQGVVPAVFNRQADAGAIFEEGIRLSLPNPADQRQLRVLAYTDPIPNGMLVAKGDLPSEELRKLKAALVSINSDPPGKAALARMRVERWEPPRDALFNPVRETARVLGLDLKALQKH